MNLKGVRCHFDNLLWVLIIPSPASKYINLNRTEFRKYTVTMVRSISFVIAYFKLFYT